MAASLERLAQSHVGLDVTSGTTGKNGNFHWMTFLFGVTQISDKPVPEMP
jgi:hypothetical protein